MSNPEKSSVGGRAARAEQNILHHQFAQVREGEAAAPRTPPHAPEAEESLLACCLQDRGDTLARLQARQIRSAAFYEPVLRTMYEVLLDLAKRGTVPDEVLLVEELRRRGLLDAVGGIVRVNEVTNRVPTTAHREYFIEQVRDCWVLREQVARATKRIEACYQWQGGNIREFILDEVADLSRVAEYVQEDQVPLEEVARRAEARMRSIADGTVDKSRLIFTGVNRFDTICTPIDILNDDTLVMIGGMPNFGKSSFLRQLALVNALKGRRVMYHILEGSVLQLINLLAASLSKVSLSFFDEQPKERQERFFAAHKKIQELCGKTLFVVDSVRTISQIENSTRELIRKHGDFHLNCVDYAQIVEAEPKQKVFTREQVVAEVGKRLAWLGKTTGCPVASAAQIDKAVQKENRRPTQADLRESATLAAAARRVIMVHVPREDMRGVEQTDSQSRVMVELLQVKNNNGPKGIVRAWFDRPWTAFSDVAADEAESGGRTADGGVGGGAKSYQKKKQ